MIKNLHHITGLTLRGNGLSGHMEIPFTLPGEQVAAEVISRKGGMQFGLPKNIQKASVMRQQPDCRHFGTCGACHYRHVHYLDSVALKKDAFFKELAAHSIAQETLQNVQMVAAEHPYHYRNNARFYLEHGKLAQHTMLTHKNFEVEECHVVSQKSWETAQHLAAILPPGVSMIEIRENSQGEQMIILSGSVDALPDFPAYSLYHDNGGPKTLLRGKPYLTQYLHIDGREFLFQMGPDSFFQVHTAMAEILYEHVATAVPTSGLLYDLYAGTGTIGIILAALHPELRVHCVELGAEMVHLAQQNAELNQVSNCTFLQHDVRTLRLTEKPAAIIVDPPRNGLQRASIEHLVSLEAEQILYVSCNPVTFLRDIDHLLPHYTLEQATIFDMMPFTSHMEVLGVFQRK